MLIRNRIFTGEYPGVFSARHNRLSAEPVRVTAMRHVFRWCSEFAGFGRCAPRINAGDAVYANVAVGLRPIRVRVRPLPWEPCTMWWTS